MTPRSCQFYFQFQHHCPTWTPPLQLSPCAYASPNSAWGHSPILMEISRGHIHYQQSPSFAASMRDVTYSCGSCGYELNLSSSSRNTATIGSKYGKSIKKGIISFMYIDEGRFNLVEELKCVPYFISKRSWGFFRWRAKLLCRNCGNHIGNAYDNNAASYPPVPSEADLSSNGVSSTPRKYDINIRSLQPSTFQAGTPRNL